MKLDWQVVSNRFENTTHYSSYIPHIPNTASAEDPLLVLWLSHRNPYVQDLPHASHETTSLSSPFCCEEHDVRHPPATCTTCFHWHGNIQGIRRAQHSSLTTQHRLSSSPIDAYCSVSNVVAIITNFLGFDCNIIVITHQYTVLIVVANRKLRLQQILKPNNLY